MSFLPRPCGLSLLRMTRCAASGDVAPGHFFLKLSNILHCTPSLACLDFAHHSGQIHPGVKYVGAMVPSILLLPAAVHVGCHLPILSRPLHDDLGPPQLPNCSLKSFFHAPKKCAHTPHPLAGSTGSTNWHTRSVFMAHTPQLTIFPRKCVKFRKKFRKRHFALHWNIQAVH